MLELFDSVRLRQDRPDLGLTRDDSGIVVSVYESPAGYTVEFLADDGDTLAVKDFSADEVVVDDRVPRSGLEEPFKEGPVKAPEGPVKLGPEEDTSVLKPDGTE